jgi:hypothetical protein
MNMENVNTTAGFILSSHSFVLTHKKPFRIKYPTLFRCSPGAAGEAVLIALLHI